MHPDSFPSYTKPKKKRTLPNFPYYAKKLRGNIQGYVITFRTSDQFLNNLSIKQKNSLLTIFYLPTFLKSQNWPRNWYRELADTDVHPENVLIIETSLKLLVILKRHSASVPKNNNNNNKKQSSASLSPNFLDWA